jgi:hypothetical protein
MESPAPKTPRKSRVTPQPDVTTTPAKRPSRTTQTKTQKAAQAQAAKRAELENDIAVAGNVPVTEVHQAVDQAIEQFSLPESAPEMDINEGDLIAPGVFHTTPHPMDQQPTVISEHLANPDLVFPYMDPENTPHPPSEAAPRFSTGGIIRRVPEGQLFNDVAFAEPAPVTETEDFEYPTPEYLITPAPPTSKEFIVSNEETGTTSPNVPDAVEVKSAAKPRFAIAEDIPKRTYKREKKKYDDHVDFAFENPGQPIEIFDAAATGSAVTTIKSNYASDVREVPTGEFSSEGIPLTASHKIQAMSVNDRAKGRKRVFITAVPVETPDVPAEADTSVEG